MAYVVRFRVPQAVLDEAERRREPGQSLEFVVAGALDLAAEVAASPTVPVSPEGSVVPIKMIVSDDAVDGRNIRQLARGRGIDTAELIRRCVILHFTR